MGFPGGSDGKESACNAGYIASYISSMCQNIMLLYMYKVTQAPLGGLTVNFDTAVRVKGTSGLASSRSAHTF